MNRSYLSSPSDHIDGAVSSAAGPDTDLAELLGAERCPAGLPLITANLLNDTAALARMRVAGPAHHVNMGGRETGWLVTRYEDVSTTLTDPLLMGPHPHTRSSRSEELPDEEDLFFLPEPEHARLRRMITRQLTHRRVAALEPRIQGQVDLLLEAIPQHEPVDLLTRFARPLPVAVLCELLGIPQPGRRYVSDYVFGWIAEAGAGTPVTKRAGIALADYLAELIHQRHTDPADDLISAMIHSPETRGSEPDVLSAVRLLLVAGHRPVTRLLADGVSVLLQDGTGWQRLVADPEQVEPTVEELLRVITPTVLSSRYAKPGARLGDVPLAEGTGVHCALAAANHDPDRFPNPAEFDPRRAPNPHLAFGLGRKHCLGAALARAEARVVLTTLVRRFPALSVAIDHGPPGTGDPRRRLRVVLDPAGAATRPPN